MEALRVERSKGIDRKGEDNRGDSESLFLITFDAIFFPEALDPSSGI
jgi:hypothetical protein